MVLLSNKGNDIDIDMDMDLLCRFGIIVAMVVGRRMGLPKMVVVERSLDVDSSLDLDVSNNQ